MAHAMLEGLPPVNTRLQVWKCLLVGMVAMLTSSCGAADLWQRLDRARLPEQESPADVDGMKIKEIESLIDSGKCAEAESRIERLQFGHRLTKPHLIVLVGRCYDKNKQHSDAEKLLRKAVELAESNYGPNSPDITVELGALGNFYQEQGRMEEAAKWYKRAAENGDVKAQNLMGLFYARGMGVAKDEKAALEWYRRAASKEDPAAQNSIGFMYRLGAGVKQDYKQAALWYRKAADRDYADAQYNLGAIYYNGWGTAKDYKQAIELWRKAANQGHTAAQGALGIAYATGRGVTAEDKEAVTWFKKAAQAGDAQAQANLGCAYEDGAGVAKNMKEAIFWYRKAAENGFAPAKAKLQQLTKNAPQQ